jgi:hypothetical protein
MKPSQLNFSFPKETTVMEIPDEKKLRWNTSFIESRSILNETGISCLRKEFQKLLGEKFSK